MIISASSLNRCGHARVLKARKPRSKNMEVSAERGTRFHKAVEQYVATGTPPFLEDMEEQGWLDLLAGIWKPPEGLRCEEALGLGHGGEYVPVVEVSPHVYLPLSMDVSSELWAAASRDSREGWLEHAARLMLTAGRGDAVQTIDRRGFRLVRAWDWKTGAWPAEQVATNLQIWLVGLAACQMLHGDAVQVGIYYARDGAFDWSEVVFYGSEEWQARFEDVKAAALVGEEPRPEASRCSSCWERTECVHAATEAPAQEAP